MLNLFQHLFKTRRYLMHRTWFVFCLGMLFVLSSLSLAQNALDSRPLDPAKDPDIDMFMGDWRNSLPFNSHGTITERAILSKLAGDDPLKPQRKGAVLTQTNRFSRAEMDPHVSTTPTTPKGEQEIYYIFSGTGTIQAGGETFDLHNGVFVLVPEGLEFTITNTGDNLLTMYLVYEIVPAGFTPRKNLVVKDEKTMSFRNAGYLQVHWSHNGKNVFNSKDGLASLTLVNLITFNAMTIGQPHSHGPKSEEVWTVVEGKNLAFLGKEIRWQGPGEAYKIPPTGFTPHSNINTTEEPCRFFYFAGL